MEQVPDLLVVDLQEGHPDEEGPLVPELLGPPEDLFRGQVEDPSPSVGPAVAVAVAVAVGTSRRQIAPPLHGVGLPAAGLAVGEHGAIPAAQRVSHHVPDDPVVHVGVGALPSEGAIVREEVPPHYPLGEGPAVLGGLGDAVVLGQGPPNPLAAGMLGLLFVERPHADGDWIHFTYMHINIYLYCGVVWCGVMW